MALHTYGERIGTLLSALSRPQHAMASISGSGKKTALPAGARCPGRGCGPPFDEDGQYCECRTDRMMNQHSLDEVIHPQHTYDGRVSGIPLIPKYIVITLLKEALGGTALATAKQELAYLMETSASQQKMPVPVRSDTVINELKYYIMLQSLHQKPGWTNASCVSQQTAQSRYAALCSTELFRRICSTQSTVAWDFDEWFSNAPAHLNETTDFGLYTVCCLGVSDYTIDHDCYTI